MLGDPDEQLHPGDEFTLKQTWLKKNDCTDQRRRWSFGDLFEDTSILLGHRFRDLVSSEIFKEWQTLSSENRKFKKVKFRMDGNGQFQLVKWE